MREKSVYESIMTGLNEALEDSRSEKPVLERHKVQNYEQWQQDHYDNMAPGEFHEEAVKYAKEHPFKGKAQKL